VTPADSSVILMYAQNGAGLGHLRRCATVATAVGALDRDIRVIIANRSLAVAAAVQLPTGCDVLKLPVFAALGDDAHGERRVLLDQEPACFAALRSALLATALATLRPAAVLVDNEPRGLQGELLEALRRSRAERLADRVLLGLRDIRGRPAHVRAKWRADGTPAVLAELYDGVLIYGDEALFDAASEYGLRDELGVDCEYVGYVFRAIEPAAATGLRAQLEIGATTPMVAVTAGSGADGRPLLELYLKEALPRLPADVVSVVVAGPLMPADEFAGLADLARGRNLRLLRSFDALRLAHAADAVVCRGGYNSVCETVHVGHTPLVVPRTTASGEQETRAQSFARAGLIAALAPPALDGAALAAGVVAQLERGRRRERSPFDPEASAARAAARLLAS